MEHWGLWKVLDDRKQKAEVKFLSCLLVPVSTWSGHRASASLSFKWGEQEFPGGSNDPLK